MGAAEAAVVIHNDESVASLVLLEFANHLVDFVRVFPLRSIQVCPLLFRRFYSWTDTRHNDTRRARTDMLSSGQASQNISILGVLFCCFFGRFLFVQYIISNLGEDIEEASMNPSM